MIRRRARFSFFAIALLLGTATAVYGCGDSDDGGDGSSGGLPGEDGSADGTTANPDGTQPIADGASPDGTKPADGGKDGDAASDGSKDADADADAEAEDADADAGPPPPPPGPLSPTYVDYDINHVLETGQSNSVASGGRPENTFTKPTSFTSAQPYTNVMFDTGVMTSKNCNGSGCPSANYVAPTNFVPLIENDAFFGGGDRVETASSAMANEMTYLAFTNFEFGVHAGYPAKHDVLVSLHGRSGNTYWCLRKGGCNYKPATEIKAFDEAVKQVQAAKAIADDKGLTYAVRAVTTIHGESDHYAYADNGDNHPEFPLVGTNGVPNRIQEYDDALIEWQEDYESMVKGITGQAIPVPLFVSGLSGWTGAHNSKLAALQLSAHVRAPGKVVLVAPGYIFDAGIKKDGTLECLHYSLLGQQQLGEYFAKAYAQVVFKGQPWEPTRPMTITRAGNVITVQYVVPVPPLAIDTTRVASIANFGFEFFENGVSQTITNVALAGADTITITLAAAPGGGTKRLRYAVNEPSPGCIGPGVLTGGGARGNIRDSDTTPSRLGFPLYNFGVAFDLAVP